MTIGARVLLTLKQQGKTQKQLADYLGTKQSTITGWKESNRNPKSETIMPICEFLGVSPTYLLTGVEDGNPPVPVQLAPREQQLLEEFRKLPSDEQLMMVGYIRGVAQRYSAGTLKKNA